MDPVLEVSPSACLFILGPQLTRQVWESSNYKSVVESGRAFLQRRKSRVASIFPQNNNLDSLRTTAGVSDVQGMVAMLKKERLYDEWLKRTSEDSRLQIFNFPDSLRWLLELQQMGAMLACTQHDTLLDDMVDQRPAMLQSNDPAFVKWLDIGRQHCSRRGSPDSLPTPAQSPTQADAPPSDAGSFSIVEHNLSSECGILHLHCAVENISVRPCIPKTQGKRISAEDNAREVGKGLDERCVVNLHKCLEKDHLTALREIFHNKLVLMIGFDSDHRHPFLPSLLKVMYPEKDLQDIKNLPILLTSSPSLPSSSSLTSLHAVTHDLFLQLHLCSLDNLQAVIVTGSSSNFTVGMWCGGVWRMEIYTLCPVSL